MMPKIETCEWFRAENHNGSLRWFAGCQADKGISNAYTSISPVCHWCGCKVKPAPPINMEAK